MSPWWAVIGLAMWLCVLLLPWRSWSTRERLDSVEPTPQSRFDDVCVLIPARNEAAHLAATLRAVFAQGQGLQVIVVDDCSTDATLELLRAQDDDGLVVVTGEALPAGWTGKLWAQSQGLARVERPLTLLLDADIVLHPGMLQALTTKLERDDLALVSVLAKLPTEGFWERLLLPAFVFFFKLLYPFSLANKPSSSVAAGAGGCMLVRTGVLRTSGGFDAIRGDLIDDCALAAQLKRHGPIWIGLSHSVDTSRRSARLEDIWSMVARTAYTQLRYSPVLLALFSALMIFAFVLPVAALIAPATSLIGGSVWVLMMICYLPTLRFYALGPHWAALLPLIGCLYLAMTWTSAWRYWRGTRSRWRGRSYS